MSFNATTRLDPSRVGDRRGRGRGVARRPAWFSQRYETGDLRSCDTFAAHDLDVP
jgi:predicted metalloprotease